MPFFRRSPEEYPQKAEEVEESPQPETLEPEEASKEEIEKEVTFEDLIQDAKSIQNEIEEQRAKKRNEEELERLERQEKEKILEKHEEAELLNRSYDMGRIYYYCLKPGWSKEEVEKIRRDRKIALGKFILWDFGKEIEERKFSTAAESGYTIRQEMFKKAKPLPRDFIESVRESIEWAERQKSDKHYQKSESYRKGLDASLENLRMLLEGFSSEAFETGDLENAVKGWIALGKIEKPEIAQKVKEKLDQWKKAGVHPLIIESVVSDLLRYQKEKQAGKIKS